MKYACRFSTPTGMNKSETINFIRAFVAIFKQMKKLLFLLLPALSIVTGLQAQGCLPDGIQFTTQEQIDNFQTDYPGCTVIEGHVEITGTNISNLEGLNVVTRMGELIISGTTFTHIEGLENLVKVGHLSIVSNHELLSLSGLSNLDTVAGALTIGWNSELPNLSGLDSISPGSVGNLYIRANTSLAECNVYSICQYLVSPGGTVTVFDNAPGCNSADEIKNSCRVGIQETHKPTFSIFPNPATESIHIQTENHAPAENIRIVSQFGQIVLKYNELPSQVEIVNLPPGLYFIALEMDGEIVSDVFLKK